jgi:hypothetical protein
MASHLHEVPVIIMAGLMIPAASFKPPAGDAGRVASAAPRISGASIYPAVQNILLAGRALGLEERMADGVLIREQVRSHVGQQLTSHVGEPHIDLPGAEFAVRALLDQPAELAGAHCRRRRPRGSALCERDRRFAVRRWWSRGDSNCRSLLGLLLMGDGRNPLVFGTAVPMDRVGENFSVRFFFWNDGVEISSYTSIA